LAVSDPFEDNNPPQVSIKIETVQSDEPPLQASLSSTSAIGRIQSANHPHQAPQIYHLHHFAPLKCCLRFIQHSRHKWRPCSTLPSSQPPRKHDEFKAGSIQRPSRDYCISWATRRLAIACLAIFWPRAVGHSTISGPFHAIQSQLRTRIHSHQFSLWFSGASTFGAELDGSNDSCRCCV
jgi:hypothetical protein